MKGNLVTPYAPAVIKLLQGPLYSDEKTAWNLLLRYRDQVRVYYAQMGLNLHVNEADGFAYIDQPELEDEEGHVIELPRLTRRAQLSYHVTLLCVLLREKLLQFEASNLESTACMVTREEIQEMLATSLPERGNQQILQRKVNSIIDNVEKLGFLRKITGMNVEYFEIRRLIKAKINAEQLQEIKERLQQYGTGEQRTASE